METLKKIREQNLMPRIELARQIGVTEGTIYNWEAGKTKPSDKNVKKLSEIFNVNPNIFLV